MQLQVIAENLGYLESPRWHERALWFSDLDRRVVCRLSKDGLVDDVFAVAGRPSGLGFVGETAFVASMDTQEVLALRPSGPEIFADLSGVAVGSLNDLAVGRDATLYVGCFGYDLVGRERPRPGPLLAVSPDGTPRVAWPEVTFANGMAITQSGRELLVAETPRRVITRFRILPNGDLAEPTSFANLGTRRQPDGICLDAKEGVWVASPFSEEVVRLNAAGQVTDVIPTPGRWAVACELGGDDGHTLYVLTAETDLKRYAAGTSHGRIEATRVPIPHMEPAT